MVNNSPLDLSAVAGSTLARQVSQGALSGELVCRTIEVLNFHARGMVSITNRGEALRTCGDSCREIGVSCCSNLKSILNKSSRLTS